MKLVRCTICLLLLLFAACYTNYYTRTFRLDTIDPGPKGFRPPDEVFTGPFGQVGEWNMGIRVISTFESNEKSVLQRDTFAVTVTAQSSERPGLQPEIDTLYISMPQTGQTTALGLQRTTADSVNYQPGIRYTYRFGDLRIPTGVDTVDVRLNVASPRSAVPEGREFRFTMVRYEGKFAKLGVRPKGW